jgi:hypothetical protein
MIKSDAEIYTELERVLRATGDTPITAVHIFEADAKVRELAGNANRLSDYLGHMWRRGVVQRYYAANDKTRSRYAYTWKDEGGCHPSKAGRRQVHLPDISKVHCHRQVRRAYHGERRNHHTGLRRLHNYCATQVIQPPSGG